MFRIFQATATFFKIIGNRNFALSVKHLSNQAKPVTNPDEVEKPSEEVQPNREESEQLKGIDALTLLRALQRDARLVDFLQEDIAAFSDEQIGAAVRDIHTKSAEVLNRFFDIKPLSNQEEGSQLEVPKEFDSGVFTLIGSVSGKGPWKGSLAHPGWQATKNDIPVYTGSEQAAKVIAPTEVEVN